LTSSSPACGTGTGRLPATRTSGPPKRVISIAVIVVGRSGMLAPRWFAARRKCALGSYVGREKEIDGFL
jgi:hypothetical protein